MSIDVDPLPHDNTSNDTCKALEICNDAGETVGNRGKIKTGRPSAEGMCRRVC